MPATKILSSFASLLNRQSKTTVWTVSFALILIVGYLDYITGYEVNAVLLYSLPIVLMVWFGGKHAGVLVSLCCAMVWWWADEAAGHHYSHVWVAIWETIIRLVYFLIFVEMCAGIKSRIELLERSHHLEREIIRIKESERRRIGHDLHDGVCQYFAAIGCAAGSLKRNLEKQGVEQAVRAGEIENLIMQGVAKTRGIARGLSPVENDNAGLQSALEELAARSTDLLNLRCTFECDSPAPIFDNVCATHLYQIAQESVSNASRHGQARNAVIRLSASPTEVALTVTDDGVGFPANKSRSNGMGLGIMHYRAQMIEAQFEILPRAGGGTIARCFFPQRA